MPTLKGFECRVDGFDDPAVILAPTASKARASYWSDLRDCCPDITIMEIKVRRAPAHDMTFPDLPAEASDLNSREREIIVHTFGGGRHIRPAQWGYRDHYCGDPSDPILNGLVALGLMSGPHGVEKGGGTGMWVGAFFYLTDKGKTVARALIGQREAA